MPRHFVIESFLRVQFSYIYFFGTWHSHFCHCDDHKQIEDVDGNGNGKIFISEGLTGGAGRIFGVGCDFISI